MITIDDLIYLSFSQQLLITSSGHILHQEMRIGALNLMVYKSTGTSSSVLTPTLVWPTSTDESLPL